MHAFWISLVAIFLAELGDKSQLMALTFATRLRPLPVLAGITVAAAVVHLASVLLGHAVGEVLPGTAVSIGAGLAFFGFAGWTLRGDRLTDAESRVAGLVRNAFVAVAVAFLLSELGDKTMLATITLATRHGWVGTWMGSTAGMVAADALAILAGRFLGTRLPDRLIRYGAAVAFAGFGLLLLAEPVVVEPAGVLLGSVR